MGWTQAENKDNHPFASLADKIQALGKEVVKEDLKKAEKLAKLIKVKHELDKKNNSISHT